MNQVEQGEFRPFYGEPLTPHAISPAVGHPDTNALLKGGPAEGVGDLECEVYDDEWGRATTRSWWIPNEVQREMIAAGGVLAIGVIQHPTPPIHALVVGPPCAHCEKEMAWHEDLRTFVCPHDE